MACGHFLARRASSLGGSGGHAPRNFLKFDVAKTAILCIFNAESKSFFLSSIPNNRFYSDHLPETLTEDEHFNDTG